MLSTPIELHLGQMRFGTADGQAENEINQLTPAFAELGAAYVVQRPKQGSEVGWFITPETIWVSY